jgi:dienelactone hydrolase
VNGGILAGMGNLGAIVSRRSRASGGTCRGLVARLALVCTTRRPAWCQSHARLGQASGNLTDMRRLTRLTASLFMLASVAIDPAISAVVAANSRAQAQTPPTPPATASAPMPNASEALTYDTLFYTRDGLRLEAYFYKPAGNGPFPLVIYNHGSRAGRERAEVPMQFIGRLLTDAGYAVLVPERRGYGKSEGPTFADDIGDDRGPRFLARLQAESEDALAALTFATDTGHLPIDPKRVAIMGWSFGGIVTTFAVGRSTAFIAAINQAPGALNWDRVPALRDALIAAAGKTRTPMLCMAARNDATTQNATQICGTAKRHGVEADVIIYPPFTPTTPVNIAPGHIIFSQQGVELWRNDVLTFLAKHLTPSTDAPH